MHPLARLSEYAQGGSHILHNYMLYLWLFDALTKAGMVKSLDTKSKHKHGTSSHVVWGKQCAGIKHRGEGCGPMKMCLSDQHSNPGKTRKHKGRWHSPKQTLVRWHPHFTSPGDRMAHLSRNKNSQRQRVTQNLSMRVFRGK